jgi:hypothetical protein
MFANDRSYVTKTLFPSSDTHVCVRNCRDNPSDSKDCRIE